MRKSVLYQEAIKKENIEKLVNKYHVAGSVGDQVSSVFIYTVICIPVP
jgi:hypothetical protein